MQSPPTLPPEIATPVPGPRARELAVRLSHVESQNVTCLVPEPPIFWSRAQGANVWDVDGNRYVDLGGAFGVVGAGHAHPRVVAAVQAQAARLLHGLGDVHPSAVKVELLEALCARFPGGAAARAILGSSGSDAVEAALKTSLLATSRGGVIAFEGAYHGLSLGALDTTWRRDFREPFAARLPGRTAFAPFGDSRAVASLLANPDHGVGCVLVEPVQGRGGERVPPSGFLRELRSLCDQHDVLLVVDEVYTGFGRTGRWFACEHESVVPDLLCVGKGLASGMPISACVGRVECMDAWPRSTGESLHTQTFLGHPPACAAALACLAVIAEEMLVERAAESGAFALAALTRELAPCPDVVEVRGLGLMLGIECRNPEIAASAVRRALEAGVLLLPSGDQGEVLSITPPLGIERDALAGALDLVVECLAA